MWAKHLDDYSDILIGEKELTVSCEIPHYELMAHPDECFLYRKKDILIAALLEKLGLQIEMKTWEEHSDMNLVMEFILRRKIDHI